ncbi:MAG: glycolate oxidase subunit GlcE [Rhizobiaceae bacterium]
MKPNRQTMLNPASEAELGEAVQRAYRFGRKLRVVGNGSREGLGNPVDANQILSVSALKGVSLYEPAALTLVASAGTPLRELEKILLAEGQHLPFEPADLSGLLDNKSEPTIGGTVATGLSGPRRIQAGAVRDGLIGVRFVDGTGTIIKNGGRVMKNVTGYDLVKLMCGSYGTLGVLTELSFKLLPRPETAAVLRFQGLTDHDAVAALCGALISPYDITGAAHLRKGKNGAPVTMIRVEGFEASVKYRSQKLQDLLRQHGEAEIETDQARIAALWKGIRDVETFHGKAGAVWRLSLRPSSSPKIVEEIARQLELEVLYDWGGGLVWLLVPEEIDAGAAAIRQTVNKYGGHATLVRANEAVRKSVGAFHPQPTALEALSEGLRQKFDPGGVLNPSIMRRSGSQMARAV